MAIRKLGDDLRNTFELWRNYATLRKSTPKIACVRKCRTAYTFERRGNKKVVKRGKKKSLLPTVHDIIKHDSKRFSNQLLRM